MFAFGLDYRVPVYIQRDQNFRKGECGKLQMHGIMRYKVTLKLMICTLDLTVKSQSFCTKGYFRFI